MFSSLNINYFRDANGNEACYELRAVIEYRGEISSTGVSLGHYVCDVQNNKTWFRTNDEKPPEMIEIFDVSKRGYAFLFQRS